jgi:magnesium transporter
MKNCVITFNNLNISDVEELIDELPEQGPRFIETLRIKPRGKCFPDIRFSHSGAYFQKTFGRQGSRDSNELPPDDRTAFFSELHGDAVKKLILHLSAADRKEALSLIRLRRK